MTLEQLLAYLQNPDIAARELSSRYQGSLEDADQYANEKFIETQKLLNPNITPKELARAKENWDLAKELALNMPGAIKSVRNAALQNVRKLKPMHSPVSGEEFFEAIKNAQKERPQISENISQYTPEELSKFKTYLSPDKKSGYAIKPDGDLINVFSSEKGRGDQIVTEAINSGATKLDAFDRGGKLPELYSKHGFDEIKREANWAPGGPDVVYMTLDPRLQRKIALEKAKSLPPARLDEYEKNLEALGLIKKFKGDVNPQLEEIKALQPGIYDKKYDPYELLTDPNWEQVGKGYENRIFAPSSKTDVIKVPKGESYELSPEQLTIATDLERRGFAPETRGITTSKGSYQVQKMVNEDPRFKDIRKRINNLGRVSDQEYKDIDALEKTQAETIRKATDPYYDPKDKSRFYTSTDLHSENVLRDVQGKPQVIDTGMGTELTTLDIPENIQNLANLRYMTSVPNDSVRQALEANRKGTQFSRMRKIFGN